MITSMITVLTKMRICQIKMRAREQKSCKLRVIRQRPGLILCLGPLCRLLKLLLLLLAMKLHSCMCTLHQQTCMMGQLPSQRGLCWLLCPLKQHYRMCSQPLGCGPQLHVHPCSRVRTRCLRCMGCQHSRRLRRVPCLKGWLRPFDVVTVTPSPRMVPLRPMNIHL